MIQNLLYDTIHCYKQTNYLVRLNKWQYLERKLQKLAHADVVV